MGLNLKNEENCLLVRDLISSDLRDCGASWADMRARTR